MRIDVVSIFPDYLAPLELALLGKARDTGLVDLRIHDLREWTHDRHRTVDDKPYGGGAGMVMRPEPWGEALDQILRDTPDETTVTSADPMPEVSPVIVLPTPAGIRFDQATAEQLSKASWLIFACGRYEGIDQRVVDHYRERVEVLELSLGDFVLNGGEVAAMAMIEAVTRLVPGFVGNAASLAEESHTTGADGALLEYPVYTKPASWRGLDVPEVLRSGDHARIETWRSRQARIRTVERRPDLLTSDALAGAHGDLTGLDLRLAVPADAGQLLTLQRAAWVSEAIDNEMLPLPALIETLDQVRADLEVWTTWMLYAGPRLVGSVRGRRAEDDAQTWDIGRLMVAEDLRGRGLGRVLLEQIEGTAPEDVIRYTLFTGARSTGNLRRYKRAGYRVSDQPYVDSDGRPDPRVVRLEKPRRRSPAEDTTA